jgi:plastocyanin
MSGNDMMDRMRISAAIAAALAMAACSGQTPAPRPADTAGAPAPAGRGASSTSPPNAVGVVNGRVPGAGGAIVVLDSKDERSFPPQVEPPVMDQVGQMFTPGLLFVRTGQPVEFRNSDDTLHNVHVGNIDTKEPAFNVAIPTGEKFTYTFRNDGFYHVGCDIHPAMSAEVFSASTPFVAAAESDGSFSFAEVPPGAYTVRAFAGGRTRQRDVEVRAGANDVVLP